MGADGAGLSHSGGGMRAGNGSPASAGGVRGCYLGLRFWAGICLVVARVLAAGYPAAGTGTVTVARCSRRARARMALSMLWAAAHRWISVVTMSPR